jgi:hypothetical protein
MPLASLGSAWTRLRAAARSWHSSVVGAPQVFLGSCVGGAGADEGQARVNRSVVIVPCPRRHPHPDAVLLESHRGFAVEASLRIGPVSRLGGGEAHKTAYLADVLADRTNGNGGGSPASLEAFSTRHFLSVT